MLRHAADPIIWAVRNRFWDSFGGSRAGHVDLAGEQREGIMTTASSVTVTFVGSGDAFGSGGRFQACIHLQGPEFDPVLLDCGASSLLALKRLGLDPGNVAVVLVSHLHGDHFGGLPFLLLDAQFARRTNPLTIAGPPGIARRLNETMECMFPGSASVSRRFEVDIVELRPGATKVLGGVTVSAFEVDHASGAPPLALRVDVVGKRISYSGDTAWTDTLLEVADGADVLIAEAYYRDKYIPYHLSHADLTAHRAQLACKRLIVTHMSADMIEHPDDVSFETAYDGLVVTV
jgi:ribonuclease BN (tRNA processing enzyme)